MTLLVYRAEGCCKHSDPEIVGTVRETKLVIVRKQNTKIKSNNLKLDWRNANGGDRNICND